MPVFTKERNQNPDFWHIWGHSYVSGAAGPLDQTGRTDSILRGAFDTEANNFQGHAVSGARLTIPGRSTGGWTRIMQEKVPSLTRGGPYVGDGGASVIFYGINDLGLLGNTTQMRGAWTHAMRAAISRCRAGVLWENDNAKHTYGAGFTHFGFTENIGSGNSCRTATTTTAATITLTLPADYQGETVAMQFWGVSSDTGHGGTVTFTGTALSGHPESGSTIYTGMVLPAATLAQTPIVKRFTGLTSAAAGLTIVATVTSIDSSGTVYFDCSWLEPLAPPAVLVCGINRLTSSGYAYYGGWSGSDSAKDADVAAWNAQTVSVIGEFDGMVQYVDIDPLVGNNAATTSDGIHPNEVGAALIVDQMIGALKRVTPPTGSPTSSLNPPARRSGQLLRPRLATHWYTSDCRAYGSNVTAVAGDVWAVPIQITQPRDRYNRAAVEAMASVSGTTIRWGIYDDVGQTGYPQVLMTEFTSAAAFTITTDTGSKQNPAVPSTGSFTWIPDPGLYWLVVKFITVGASHTFRSVAGFSQMMPNATTTGTGATMASGWKLTGQGTTALPTTFPTGASLSDNCITMFIQCAQVA